MFLPGESPLSSDLTATGMSSFATDSESIGVMVDSCPLGLGSSSPLRTSTPLLPPQLGGGAAPAAGGGPGIELQSDSGLGTTIASTDTETRELLNGGRRTQSLELLSDVDTTSPEDAPLTSIATPPPTTKSGR